MTLESEEKMIKRYQISDKIFDKISKLVFETIGVHLTDKKKAMVNSRLSKRIRKLGLNSFEEYYNYLCNNERELVELYNILTTNVTKFFREKHHFEFLRNKVFPKLKEKNRSKVKAWSAGCSTGEEPYSLAIVLDDFFNTEKWNIKLLASDINTAALKTASRGVYSYKKVKTIPYDLLTKYFKLRVEKGQKIFKVKQELKNLITYKRINLNPKQRYPIKSKLDFIFCRNVFIYFDKPTRKKILDQFARHLKKKGYLFLGHSETIKVQEEGGKRWRSVGRTTYQKIN